MRLLDLNPRWTGAGGEGIRQADGSPVPERAGTGMIFECPCGSCGQPLYIPFKNPLDGGMPLEPGRVMWGRIGENFDTLTLAPSIQRVGGCGWHGWIRNGEIVRA
jgi:hypothetical protein